MLDIYGIDKYKNISIDEVVKATMEWHFSEKTGSKFWINKKKSFEFDPLKDINKFDDLKLFDDCVEELRTININDLIPKGIRKFSNEIKVFESGGTTGNPQRIIDGYSRIEALGWVERHLELHGIPYDLEGDWLHVGPSGPHIVGTSMGRLAANRKKLCYYIDFDPRWVKYAVKIGKKDCIDDYIQHIVNQAIGIIETQNISIMVVTPLVLEAMSNNDRIVNIINEKIKLIIWAGTSMNEDTLHALQTYIFGDVKFMGIYGNTMMGISPQRVYKPDDICLCTYQSYYPYSIVEVVDENDPTKLVEYGKKGQVQISLMTPDLFIPKHLERDEAYRIKPIDGYIGDGVAEIGPINKLKNDIFEGVY